MSNYSKLFLEEANRISFDEKHRKTIRFNMAKYDAAFDDSKVRYANLEKAKHKAAGIKRFALDHLDELLLQFEAKFTDNGGTVFWAENTKDALEYILSILSENNAKSVVKSKSMTTEEIGFNEFLEERDFSSLETDLGEYIVQIAGEKPYHIVTPAMHKSRKDVAELFNEKFGTDADAEAEYLTAFVREKLRKNFVTADIGVTGGNFLVADIGAVAVTENEGNAIMSTAFPKIHIAIVGIEKIIPKFTDLALLWPLLAAHGTGQAISVYNSVFTASKKAKEADGPSKMYVILLDNKRTELFNVEPQSDVLACIRCGACLNACPVYRNIGGYTYESTYSGPIGSVITPFFNGFKNFKHLSFACTLCGKCTEICPVKIDLHSLLLQNRSEAVERNYTAQSEKIVMKMANKALLNRWIFDFGSVGLRNFFVRKFVSKFWGPRRSDLILKKSFSRQMKELKNKK